MATSLQHNSITQMTDPQFLKYHIIIYILMVSIAVCKKKKELMEENDSLT